jgi:hypothetical protein
VALDVEQDSTPDDATPGPVLDPQRPRAGAWILRAAAEEARFARADVPQAVPLRGGLRVVRVQALVDAVAIEREDLVADRLASEERRVGTSTGRFSAKTSPARTTVAAAATSAGVSRSRVPRSWSRTSQACRMPVASCRARSSKAMLVAEDAMLIVIRPTDWLA